MHALTHGLLSALKLESIETQKASQNYMRRGMVLPAGRNKSRKRNNIIDLTGNQ